MKYEKFKIINLIKDLIINIEKNLVNFPKKEIELKHQLRNDAYQLLLIMYEANVTKNQERRAELQEKSIAYVKHIDFLINLCYDKKIINEKKYLKFGDSLDTIIRYIMGWMNVKQRESQS